MWVPLFWLSSKVGIFIQQKTLPEQYKRYWRVSHIVKIELPVWEPP